MSGDTEPWTMDSSNYKNPISKQLKQSELSTKQAGNFLLSGDESFPGLSTV